MHYEINVARNGLHIFATAERSLDNLRDTVSLYKDLKIAFPTDKGYRITVSKVETTYTSIDMGRID